MFTQVGVKQLTDFLRTVTAASDLADCTLVNCVIEILLRRNIHETVHNTYHTNTLMQVRSSGLKPQCYICGKLGVFSEIHYFSYVCTCGYSLSGLLLPKTLNVGTLYNRLNETAETSHYIVCFEYLKLRKTITIFLLKL